MTGLDKIIEQITSQAEKTSADILQKAQAQADEIIAQAEKDGAESAQRIIANGEEKYKDIIARGESAAALYKRKELLSAKQQIISDMLNNAKSYLLSLPDKEYFELLLSMIEKHATGETGEIAFNKKDLARLPDRYEESVKAASESSLTISKTPVKVDGGFVLIYGGIEENCSFDALFSASYEQLSDEVHSFLFEK